MLAVHDLSGADRRQQISGAARYSHPDVRNLERDPIGMGASPPIGFGDARYCVPTDGIVGGTGLPAKPRLRRGLGPVGRHPWRDVPCKILLPYRGRPYNPSFRTWLQLTASDSGWCHQTAGLLRIYRRIRSHSSKSRTTRPQYRDCHRNAGSMPRANFVTPILNPRTIDAKFRDCGPNWLPGPRSTDSTGSQAKRR